MAPPKAKKAAKATKVAKATKQKATTKVTATKVTATKAAKAKREDAYKVIEGKFKQSDVDTVCLFAPASEASRVHDALQAAKEKYHEWSIGNDELPLDWIQRFPTCLGRMIDTVPVSFPDGQSEDELLDLLLTGGSSFVTKYVIVEGFDGKDPDESVLISVEIKKKKHMSVYERFKELDAISEANGDMRFIGSVELWERSEFLSRFGKNWVGYPAKTVATDAWVKNFLSDTEDMDDMDVHYLLRNWSC